ncbi:MAG: long-chain acyl-CoA synthetase [Halieaceae bacterium]
MSASAGSHQSAIVDAILQRAASMPNAVALVGPQEILRYRDLEQRIGDFSAKLENTGAHTLGIALDNSIEWAVADLAALDRGLQIVPIPTFFTPGQQAHLLKSACVDLVLGDLPLSQEDGWKPVDVDATANPLFQSSNGRSAPRGGKITFTSGSSDAPKGVVLSPKTIERTAQGIVTALSRLTLQRHLSVLPFATLLENIAGLYAPLLNGGEVYIPSAAMTGVGDAGLDIENFSSLLNGSDADTIILVPQLLTAVVTLCEMGLLSMDSFRLMAVGGGKVAPELLRRAAQYALPVCEGYGLSECCSVLTLNLPGETRPGSVGKPLPHADIRVSADAEIQVRSPVMDGYLQQESSPEEWYATGDLGYFDADGFLYVDGRRRNVFITSYGRNVSPEWIEASLTQHAAIAQALAFGEARDHNLILLWLRYPLEQEALAELISVANSELPDYASIHALEVVQGLPDTDLITANGRLKRALALERYAALIEQHYEQHSSLLNHKDASSHAIL